MGSDESQDHVSTSFIRLAGPPRRRRAADPPLMAQPLHTFYSQVTSTVNNGPAEKPMGENFGVREGGEEREQRVLVYVS